MSGGWSIHRDRSSTPQYEQGGGRKDRWALRANSGAPWQQEERDFYFMDAACDVQELVQEYAHFDPSVFGNPYPLYSRLRAEEPVCWCEALGCWLLTRYDDVVFALREAR